jgi:hypothetical protein
MDSTVKKKKAPTAPIPVGLFTFDPPDGGGTIKLVLNQSPFLPSGMPITIGPPYSQTLTPGVPFDCKVPDAHYMVIDVPDIQYVDPKDAPTGELPERNSAKLSQKRRNG